MHLVIAALGGAVGYAFLTRPSADDETAGERLAGQGITHFAVVAGAALLFWLWRRKG